MAQDDYASPEWQAFAADLLKQRRDTPRTATASASFVDRMTSSAADPGAAAREEGASPERDGTPAEPSRPGKI